MMYREISKDELIMLPKEDEVAVRLKDSDSLIDQTLVASAENLLASGIHTDQEWEQTRKLSDAIKDQTKRLDATRKIKVGPFNDFVDAINGWFKPRMDYLKKLEKDLGNAYTRYFNEREAKRRAAQEEADRIKREQEAAAAEEQRKADEAAEAARVKAEREAKKLNKDSLFGDEVEVRMADETPASIVMQPVISSNVDSVGYDAAGQRMAVQFKNLKRYIFKNVPEPIFKSVVQAKSVGIAFNQVIKGKYDIEAIEAVTPTVAAPVPTAPIPSVPEALKPAAPIRKTWHARIMDSTKVPREFCVPSDGLIMLAYEKGIREIPGVEFYCEETVVRSRR